MLDGRVHVAAPGTFVRVPPGVEHEFANDGDVPARFLNIYVPGGFEDDMPSIVEWFAQHPSRAQQSDLAQHSDPTEHPR